MLNLLDFFFHSPYHPLTYIFTRYFIYLSISLFLPLKVNRSSMRADALLTTVSSEFRIVVDTW